MSDILSGDWPENDEIPRSAYLGHEPHDRRMFVFITQRCFTSKQQSWYNIDEFGQYDVVQSTLPSNIISVHVKPDSRG